MGATHLSEGCTTQEMLTDERDSSESPPRVSRVARALQETMKTQSPRQRSYGRSSVVLCAGVVQRITTSHQEPPTEEVQDYLLRYVNNSIIDTDCDKTTMAEVKSVPQDTKKWVIVQLDYYRVRVWLPFS